MKTKSILLLAFLVAMANTISAQKKIAFIGQADVYSNNIPTANDGLVYDDDRAAATWFMETFLPNHSNEIAGSYFSFQEVAEGADISSYDAIWIQADGATYTERLYEWPRGTTEANGDKHCVLRESGFEWNGQCSTLEDAFMAKIRAYYKSGKNIFLGNFAGRALEVIGTFDGLSNPWEYRPNQLFGDTSVNPANTDAAWGTNWNSSGNSLYIAGISTSETSCTYAKNYIEFLGSNTEKKNRALQYNLNRGRIYDEAGSSTSTLDQRRQAFQTTLNAQILLENCDGNEIQGAQFNPRNTGDGIIVWYGAGVYDWYAPTGSNENVKKLTENTLLYLAKTSALAVKEDSSISDITVYPNPTSSILNINTDLKVISEIYDTAGKKVMKNTGKRINVEGLGSGIYLIKVTESSTGKAKTLKFIKK